MKFRMLMKSPMPKLWKLGSLPRGISGWLGLLMLAVGVMEAWSVPARADLTAAHRQELLDIRRDLQQVPALMGKKDLEGAGKLLDTLDERLKKVVEGAQIDDQERSVQGIFKLLELRRSILTRQVQLKEKEDAGKEKPGNEKTEKTQPAKQGVAGKAPPAGAPASWKSPTAPNAFPRSAGSKKASPVDFAKEIAPLFVAQCVRCHNENESQGGLRLDTYAGVLAGGKNGPLLFPRNSNASPVIDRLMAFGPAMMPKGGKPLPEADVLKIVYWIDQGAKFEGDKQAQLADIADSLPAGGRPRTVSTNDPKPNTNSPKPRETTAEPAKPWLNRTTSPKITIASGLETVSFTRDIAPFMVNLCVGCHTGGGEGARQTGFLLDSFESLMRGGKNGSVINPGNPESSRLWHLVGKQEPVKMPPGQALITRKNHRNLRIWLEEGAHFDGKSAKASLRSLVPTPEEVAAQKFGSLSPADFEKYRREQLETLWKKAYPHATANKLDGGKDFLLCGSIADERLKQVATWADEDAGKLRRFFHERSDGPLWRGRLAVFVLKDRTDYEEFARTHDGADVVPREVHGHAKCGLSQEFAYVVLHDTGDDPSPSTPTLHANLTENLTQALLQRSRSRVPDWIGRGVGLVLASRTHARPEYFKHLNSQAYKLAAQLGSPEEVFSSNAFAPDDLGPIGFTLVTYFLKNGTESAFVKFVHELQEGGTLEVALQKVYNIDKSRLASGYLGSLSSGRQSRKRGK